DDGRRGRDNPRGRAGGETSDAVTNNARRDPETRRLCVPPAPEVDGVCQPQHHGDESGDHSDGDDGGGDGGDDDGGDDDGDDGDDDGDDGDDDDG
ncbi:unnamed protein product, partial [Lampetra planeri]